jgi:hypothetical protein
MDRQPKLPDALHFKVNAEIKSIIGKDLINNDNIAVVELVKNSYDASASSVKIEFLIDKNQLIISDDGSGMSLSDIENKWLNIAFSEKKVYTKKRLAGNKGVGRFSCDRLGATLYMYTVKSDHEPIKLSINWLDFENAEQDKEIRLVPIKYELVTLATIEKETTIKLVTGTILIIDQLREYWDYQKLLLLKRELQRFANPHQDIQVDAFHIKLICNMYKEQDSKETNPSKRINGVIENTVFDDLGFRTSYIEAVINKDEIITSLYHRGNKLFTLHEINTYSLLDDIKIVVMYLVFSC